jgi:hypothetical protein
MDVLTNNFMRLLRHLSTLSTVTSISIRVHLYSCTFMWSCFIRLHRHTWGCYLPWLACRFEFLFIHAHSCDHVSYACIDTWGCYLPWLACPFEFLFINVHACDHVCIQSTTCWILWRTQTDRRTYSAAIMHTDSAWIFILVTAMPSCSHIRLPFVWDRQAKTTVRT